MSSRNGDSKPTEQAGIDGGTVVTPPTRVPVSSSGASAEAQQQQQQSQQSQQQPQQSQQQLSQTSSQVAPAPAASSSTSSSSIPLYSTLVGRAPSAASSASALATSSRSNYKTYILSNGVFEVENRYEIREIIGQGAYGIVCSALDRHTGQFVAVKKIENVFDHRSLAKRTLRELKLVRTFNHENILGLDRVMRPHSASFNHIYLVSELMETDLACVIRSPQELTDEHCQFFIYQVLRGLKYIHSASVIHRDLKPRNLLVNSNCDLKICDFGLARVDEPEDHDRTVMSNYIATRWYRAPEVILSRKRYTKAVDMWSVGCILAELIGRKPIFPGRDSFHQITLIVGILGTPPPASAAAGATGSLPRKSPNTGAPSTGPTDDYISALPRKAKIPFQTLYPKSSPLACDLLDKLLCFEPEHRLTVEQALRHPYLADLHCEDDEPVCSHLDLTDFYFEYLRVTKDDLRVLIHQEIVNHYKEETNRMDGPATTGANTTTTTTDAAAKKGTAAGGATGPAAAAAASGSDAAFDNFPGGMRKGLPGAAGGAGGAAQPPPPAQANAAARKGRRKSF